MIFYINTGVLLNFCPSHTLSFFFVKFFLQFLDGIEKFQFFAFYSARRAFQFKGKRCNNTDVLVSQVSCEGLSALTTYRTQGCHYNVFVGRYTTIPNTYLPVLLYSFHSDSTKTRKEKHHNKKGLHKQMAILKSDNLVET